MLLEVQEFRRRVAQELANLVRDLQAETGRFGPAEAMAWEASLAKAAEMLESPKLKDFHLYVGERGSLALEYRLPASASYCDLVLLRRNEARPSAVIFELKDWHPGAARPGAGEEFVILHGELALHPAAQVRGYVDYCRRFHSAVIDRIADVHGCVYMTRSSNPTELREVPHDRLAEEFPIFGDRQEDVDELLPAYVLSHLSRPDMEFAASFERGTYRQDRSFCAAVAELIRTGRSPFALLDHQRLALAVCLQTADEVLRSGRKAAIVVEGPPGSGKSAVAAHLWAALRQRPDLERDACVIATTSSAQRSNWRKLFERTRRGAAGVVLPVASFAPATTGWVGDYQKAHGAGALRPEQWRANIEICRSENRGRLAPATLPLVSIVDEAHALINPEEPRARAPAGYPVAFGPQAWHVIRASRLAVFLMDPEQGFRLRENTTVEAIRSWAHEQGAQFIGPISLAGAQFRAAGSVEYTAWVDELLGFGVSSLRWRPNHRPNDMQFQIVSDPFALDEALRARIEAGQSSRLVAAFARPWVTAPANDDTPARSQEPDFVIPVNRNDGEEIWTRRWNYIPRRNDYTFFVQAPPGSPMAADPLTEVGCPLRCAGIRLRLDRASLVE
jgi:uncharacterized protein